MKRVLLYEYVVSSGRPKMLPMAEQLKPLMVEARAMITAMAADLAALDGIEVMVLRDINLRHIAFPGCSAVDVESDEAEREILKRLSAACDAAFIIAPETAGILHRICIQVEQAGGCLVGPSSDVVALTADKQHTAEHLAAAGVPTPHGIPLHERDPLPASFGYPAILKLRDGVGSGGVFKVHQAGARESQIPGRPIFELRLERYVPGLAASVAVLCGPHEFRPLPACLQRLTDDGRFTYLGGSLPLAPELNDRAQRLALAAVRTLPNPRGYLGVDLVLGDDPGGSGDAVIEINPRLTTSYVGLRAAACGNLALAIWAIAAGEPPESVRLSFVPDRLEFDADGTVRRLTV